MHRSPQKPKEQIEQLKLILWGWVRKLQKMIKLGSISKSRTRVLVVRLDHLGDFALWAPYASSLRECFPLDKYELTLIANENWIEIAKKLLPFDIFMPFNIERRETDPIYFRTFLSQLGKKRFDIYINPRFTRLVTEEIIRIHSGASFAFAFQHREPDSNPFAFWLLGKGYTKLIQDDSTRPHMFDRNQHFLNSIRNQPTPPKAVFWRECFVMPAEAQIKPYFCIFPGAGALDNRWPPNRFAELARALVASTGWVPIVCGSYRESELCQKLLSDIGYPGKLLAGEYSLENQIGWICGAKIVIGNDSGPCHVAAMAGIPSFSVIGGGSFTFFHPYPPQIPPGVRRPVSIFHEMPCFSCDWQCTLRTGTPEDPVPCLEAVSLENALIALHAWAQQEDRTSF